MSVLTAAVPKVPIFLIWLPDKLVEVIKKRGAGRLNDFFTVEPTKSKAVLRLDKSAAIAMFALALVILTVVE